jgi:hypothetical protein
MTLVNAAISIAISLAVFVVFSAVIEAARRRNIDPVGDIARFLSPDVAPTDEAT